MPMPGAFCRNRKPQGPCAHMPPAGAQAESPENAPSPREAGQRPMGFPGMSGLLFPMFSAWRRHRHVLRGRETASAVQHRAGKAAGSGRGRFSVRAVCFRGTALSESRRRKYPRRFSPSCAPAACQSTEYGGRCARVAEVPRHERAAFPDVSREGKGAAPALREMGFILAEGGSG